MNRKRMRTWVASAAAAVIVLTANECLGEIVIRVTEVAGNLVVTTSGSVDTTQWGAPGGATTNPPYVYIGVNSGAGFSAFGVGQQDFWLDAGSAGPFVFTDHGLAGANYNAVPTLTSGGGDVAFRQPGLAVVWLPSGYVSGTPVNQVLTIPGATFASAGVTNGAYSDVSWGGTSPDKITFAIGTAVPVELQSFDVE